MPSTSKTFDQHLDLSETEVEKILSMSLDECFNSPLMKQQLDNLNVDLLKQTLPTAKAVLQEQLPPFYNWLKNELKVERVPDSPDHTTRWVVNFLNNQESLMHLVELHRPVSPSAMEEAVPALIDSFTQVKDSQIRQQWQGAIAALCLILVVDGRERAQAS